MLKKAFLNERVKQTSKVYFIQTDIHLVFLTSKNLFFKPVLAVSNCVFVILSPSNLMIKFNMNFLKYIIQHSKISKNDEECLLTYIFFVF